MPDTNYPVNPRRNLYIRLVPIFFVCVVTICAMTGCSKPETIEKPTATSEAPILQIKQAPYTFSMYPQFETETKSRLKLDIRDSQGRFIHGARAIANLTARDGHKQKANFMEDNRLEKYIAEIPLKHHEDYIIETQIDLAGSPGSTFKPQFSFHCCDPIPELLDQDMSADKEGGSAK